MTQAADSPTALESLLIKRIAATGPISIADYMADCLLHPDHGYYTSRDPFGAAGDFTTSPEISQMFGEVIGLCLAAAWQDQGGGAFTLAELGPGRGTLMRDLLRAASRVPGFLQAADTCLVEASDRLQQVQAKTLEGRAVTWLRDVSELPDGPLFLVANEFFDALPIRQFTRAGAGWREHLVTVQDGRLCRGLGPAAPYAALAHRLGDVQDGQIVETCAPAQPIVAELAARIARFGGGALLIDYGGWRSGGDTLQALRAHRPVSALAAPGTADLTAHVDFEALARAAAEAGVSQLTPQGVFLERLGITQRAQVLARGLDGSNLDTHIAAHRRLTHPDEMGTLFKVLGLHPKGAAALPGLAT